MFNSYVANPTLNANASFSLNAVSGTLVKRHPKSRFVIVSMDKAQDIFNAENPTIDWGEEEYKVTKYEDDYSKPYISGFSRPQKEYTVTRKRPVKVPVVVLQSMIIAENKLMCEVVRESDFISGFLGRETEK